MLQSWRYAPFENSSLAYVIGVGVNWSISTEWFFYPVYPPLSVLVLKIRRPLTMICVLPAWCVFWGGLSSNLAGQAAIDACGVSHYGSVAGVAWGYQDSFYRWLLYLSPYSRVGEFVRVGCLVAQFYLVLRDIPPTGA